MLWLVILSNGRKLANDGNHDVISCIMRACVVCSEVLLETQSSIFYSMLEFFSLIVLP